MPNAVKRVDIKGNAYVPLKEALDQVGGNIQWDNTNKQAHVVSGGHRITINMADENVDLDGQTVVLSRPPLVKDDTLYVPEDFFSNVLGQQIYFA
jgi:internalin A